VNARPRAWRAKAGAALVGCALFTCALPSAASAQADVSVSKGTDNPSPTAGQTFNYQVTVSNSGPMTATSVTMQDQLPSQVSFVQVVGIREAPNHSA
jgi:uncharacterized repeat protein (TIGR01451 family)